MALDKWTNTGLSTLASGIDASQLTATLAAGTGSRFPADTFNVVIWDSTSFANPIDAADREIVRCTSRTGDVLTIVRGQEGTTGVAHNTAGKTYSVALIVSQKFRDDLHAFFFQTISVQVFTASGTYTKPSNLIAARVIVVGGGGNGANGPSTADGGSGGGSGAYSESLLLASAIGTSEIVTVGAAAATSSLGALVTANGGSNAPTTGIGGSGGTPGTGQHAIAGSDGGSASGNLGGNGGGSAFGGSGKGGLTAGTAGAVGKANTGGGGGGAGSNTGGGGAGGSGIVIVQEFRAG